MPSAISISLILFHSYLAFFASALACCVVPLTVFIIALNIGVVNMANTPNISAFIC